MENRLKCVLMLSLKEMVLRRMAALLSSDGVMLFKRVAGIESIEDEISWMNTHEDKVKYKISKLLLPKSLRKEMIDKVRHISLEIRKWWNNNKHIAIYTEGICLAWTSAGTIDYKKIWEAYSGCDMVHVERRFIKACTNCLEDYIPLLWEELDEDRKEYFLRSNEIVPVLHYCWPFILKGKLFHLERLWITPDSNLTSFNQWAFENSALLGNKTAAEYFFRKLTSEERGVSVMRATLTVLSCLSSANYFGSHNTVLCYLLSLMTTEQQMEATKKNPARVMLCFYVMSWQDLLVENTSLIWSFLPRTGFGELSKNIHYLVKFYLCHAKSFREFFIMSPLDFKKYFVHGLGEYGRSPACRFLDAFIGKEDSDSIECMFRNLDAADRVTIVFQPDVLYLFHRSVREKDGRRMVEVCLREAELSMEDRETLKKDRPCLIGVIKELYEFDVTAKKGQKRKLEDCSN